MECALIILDNYDEIKFSISIRLRCHYFKLFTVYLRIALVVLVIVLIICRAAASQGQWIVASLLFLAAVLLSMDYLIIFTYVCM